MELEDLKKEYGKLAKKYKLPEFVKVNECFEIDRIERDTDFILREVRKAMMDKVIGYIRFLEMMLNPSQAPPMFLMFVKTLQEKEIKLLKEVYTSFIEMEIFSLKLEVDYSEEGEAKAVKRIFEDWNASKPNLIKILDVMEKNWKSAGSDKKTRSYFG